MISHEMFLYMGYFDSFLCASLAKCKKGLFLILAGQLRRRVLYKPFNRAGIKNSHQMMTVYSNAKFNNYRFIVINGRLNRNHYLPTWQFTWYALPSAHFMARIPLSPFMCHA